MSNPGDVQPLRSTTVVLLFQWNHAPHLGPNSKTIAEFVITFLHRTDCYESRDSRFIWTRGPELMQCSVVLHNCFRYDGLIVSAFLHEGVLFVCQLAGGVRSVASLTLLYNCYLDTCLCFSRCCCCINVPRNQLCYLYMTSVSEV